MTESAARPRRKQADRTAETRAALFAATIKLLHIHGYAGTSTEAIAAEANVSRGALRHHYPTRALLMADVLYEIYQDEQRFYRHELETKGRGKDVADWPQLCWDVLSRPSGHAALEIFQASRNDPELGAQVSLRNQEIEAMSMTANLMRFGRANLPAIRLIAWAIRGLTIAESLLPESEDIQDSVKILRDMVDAAVREGIV